MIQFREGRDEDRPSLTKVLWKAFEANRTLKDVEKESWIAKWNQPQDNDWAYVAVDGNKVVANLSFFATDENVIRGRPIRFAGVWAVATDPLYRKQGLVRSLFKEAFPRMKKEGAVLSILDPFYRAFYEKFDYALGEKRAKHVFKKQDLRVGKTRSDVTFREITEPEDIPKIVEIRKSMVRFGSRFLGFKSCLEGSIKKGNFFILENDKETLGTVRFTYSDNPPGYHLLVGNTCYKYDDVFPSIVKLVSKYAVNAAKVTWNTDIDVPVRHFFDCYTDTESHMIGSMMMRVIDFVNYCKSIEVPETATEQVTVNIEDDYCSWNSGTYTLIPNQGRLQIKKSDSDPDVKLSAFQLSQVISGTIPATMLQKLHDIECSSETAEKLETIFPEDNFVAYMRF